MAKRRTVKRKASYSKGHWYSLGFLIGFAVGFAIGVLMGNIAIGPILGVAFGAIFGILFAERYTPHKKNVTAEEIRRNALAKTISIGIGLIVVILVIGTQVIR